MKRIFCILGKSSAGKDSIVTQVSKDLNMPIATSFTTRPMREGEVEGREYNFITEKEFMEKEQSGQVAECTLYNVADGKLWYYGLTRSEIEKGEHTLIIVNPDGLEQLTDLYGDKVVSILLECDGLERLQRSINRDSTANPKEVCRRFLADEEDFKYVCCDYLVDTTSKEGESDGVKKHVETVKRYILDEIKEEEE